MCPECDGGSINSLDLLRNKKVEALIFFVFLLPRLYFYIVTLLVYVAGSICQHLLYNSAQPLTEYDIYYFLSHIISALHKVLINAFGDEAFTPLRKA